METIRYFRKQNKMRQKDLADLLFVKENVISHYENGRRTPSIATLKKLSEIFHEPIEKLITPKRYMSVDSIPDTLEVAFDYLTEEPSFMKKEKQQFGVYYYFTESDRAFTFFVCLSKVFFYENTKSIPYEVRNSLTPFEAPLGIRLLFIKALENYLVLQRDLEYLTNFHYLIPYFYLKRMENKKNSCPFIKSEYMYSLRYHYCHRVFRTNMHDVYADVKETVARYELNYRYFSETSEGIVVSR